MSQNRSPKTPSDINKDSLLSDQERRDPNYQRASRTANQIALLLRWFSCGSPSVEPDEVASESRLRPPTPPR